MPVTLGDTEAERIADMLESLSALEPDEVPGHQYDDGMKADATMYADELRERQGNDPDDLLDALTYAYRHGTVYHRDDAPATMRPEILLGDSVPPGTTRDELRAAAREKLRRDGYDPDDFTDQINRRLEGWLGTR